MSLKTNQAQGLQKAYDHTHHLVQEAVESIETLQPTNTEEQLNQEAFYVDPTVANTSIRTAFSYGIRGDGSDETLLIQNALNDAAATIGRFFWNKQTGSHYLIGQIAIPSDLVLIFEPGTIVQAVDTLRQTPAAEAEALFSIFDKQNITILAQGLTTQMNKAAYTKEWNHNWSIRKSQNIRLCDINSHSSGGDGFYIGGVREFRSGEWYDEKCTNIFLYRCYAHNNRRQGLSLTNVDTFLIESCGFHHTGGTAPEAGIDCEPNPNCAVKNGINRFTACNANQGAGLLVAGQMPASLIDNVFIDHLLLKNNARGIYAVSDLGGAVKVRNSLIQDSKINGIEIAHLSSTSLVEIMATTIATSGGIGLSLYDVPHGTVQANRNTIQKSGTNGLQCYQTIGCDLQENTFAETGGYEVRLVASSWNNLSKTNMINNLGGGSANISLDQGSSFNTCLQPQSKGNLIADHLCSYASTVNRLYLAEEVGPDQYDGYMLAIVSGTAAGDFRKITATLWDAAQSRWYINVAYPFTVAPDLTSRYLIWSGGTYHNIQIVDAASMGNVFKNGDFRFSRNDANGREFVDNSAIINHFAALI